MPQLHVTNAAICPKNTLWIWSNVLFSQCYTWPI